MAMEKAIVSTTSAREGLPVHHEADLLLADTPEDLRRAVVRVLATRNSQIAWGVARHGLCASSLVGSSSRRFAAICESIPVTKLSSVDERRIRLSWYKLIPVGS